MKAYKKVSLSKHLATTTTEKSLAWPLHALIHEPIRWCDTLGLDYICIYIYIICVN